MPVRPSTSRGSLAWRWGRHGTSFTYGHGTGRTSDEAAALAALQGRRKAIRGLLLYQSSRPPRTDRAASKRAIRARKQRPRKGDQPLFSAAIESLMDRMLRGRVSVVERLFAELAGPVLRDFQAELDERRQDTSALDVVQVIAAIRLVLPGMAGKDAEGLRFLAGEIDEDVMTMSDRQLSRLLNIPIATTGGSEAAIQAWLRTNIKLIEDLQRKVLDQIEDLVMEAMASGRPTKALAKDIDGRFNVGRSRASLIARDQTAKLASQINQERQTAVGITKYIWSTSGDERVRVSHVALDGRIFTWAEGAPGDSGLIHPGIEFQCRCDPQPVAPGADEAPILAAAEAMKEQELIAFGMSPTVRGEIPNRNTFGSWNEKRLEELRRGVRGAVGL